MRPSRAQLRLAEYQAMDKELKDQILVAISDALDSRIGRVMHVTSVEGMKYMVDDGGIMFNGGSEDNYIRPWSELSTSRILEVYTHIVKKLSL